LEALVPQLAGVTIERVERLAGRVWIAAAAAGEQGCYPDCGTVSQRVHSRYRRQVADTPISGTPVVLALEVRRFFCEQPGCSKRTFVEQVPELTARYARRTPGLGRLLAAIGLALAGRAGARLGARLGLPISRSTLLRLLERLPDPQMGAVAVLGVDDFALRRGHVYGTVLIDMDSHRPVDLLPDREAGTFAEWLRGHPGVQVICRDRAGAYAEGARDGAPDAVQIADRWHLWHNLAEHVEKTAARHRGCWAAAPEPTPAVNVSVETQPRPQPLAEQAAVARREDSSLARRTRDRHARVHELREQGKGIKTIMRELGLAKETVRRFVRAQSVDELLATARDGRASVLDEFKPYLNERFNAGHTNGSRLFTEIRDQGYRGSLGTVLGYLRPFRALAAAPAAAPTPPTVRAVTSTLLRHPDRLDPADQLTLKEVRARCPHLDALADHVGGFAGMMVGRHGDRLDDWLARVEADDQPDLHRFANGLRRDHNAVRNGLTLPHSSGVVEGAVNRIKMIKRQMYGRAGFDLLRKRVLLAH